MLGKKDWDLLLSYLGENERIFSVWIDDLLTVDGVKRDYKEVYRKVQAVRLEVLAAANLSAKTSSDQYVGVLPEGEHAGK